MDPKHCFPPQPLVIAACVELAKRMVEQGTAVSPTDNNPQRAVDGFFTVQTKQSEDVKPKQRKVLVVMGTYTIGKERIVKAIAQALKTKIFCEPRKQAILRCQADPELDALLTSNPLVAGVHIVPLKMVSGDDFKDYVARYNGHFTHAIGFRPTGWTFTPANGTDTLPTVASVISREKHKTYSHSDLRPSRGASALMQTYGVPYSEHSSFFELTCFALSLDWVKIIATVNLGEKSRAKMDRWFEKWSAERKKNKSDYIVPFRDTEYW
jgi:DNA cross-link repair 1A protein